MATVQPGRFTADLSGAGDEIVVLVIGMRINKPWKVRAWWPVFTAMPRMLRHLSEHSEKGLLGVQGALFPQPVSVQYWRSFEHLERFARNTDDMPAHGLTATTAAVPVRRGRDAARDRIGAR